MDMGDMPMDDAGLGMDVNYAFAHDYWYILAGVVGFLTAVHGVEYFTGRQRSLTLWKTKAHYSDCQLTSDHRLRACDETSIERATRPNGRLGQAWATATAILREVSHPQFYMSKAGFQWATPPPLGRVLVLLCYWSVIIYMMTWKAIKDDANFWERIGFRNAWVSIMQLPLIYLLSMKINIIGFLIGSSHERLNWLHRWIARTLFITATVHGWHFWTEWVRADFVEYELSIMPLVRYGLGAWGVLLLNVVVGFVPLRQMMYEVWLVQHILSSIAILVLLSFHIPADAMYLLWMSISFLALDRAARWTLAAWQNVRWNADKSTCQGMRRLGHKISARAIGETITIVTIKDVHFKWHAGQHIYLWIPRLGLLETHPYTIACAHQISGVCCCNSVQLIVRAHKGFSKRIHDFAVGNPDNTLTGFVVGPFGVRTNWQAFETLVLIGASTGASFTIPILEDVANAKSRTCIRRIEVTLTAKTFEEIQYYVQRAMEACRIAQEKGIVVRLHIATTGSKSQNRPRSQEGVNHGRRGCCCSNNEQPLAITSEEKGAEVQSAKMVPCSGLETLRARSITSSSSVHEDPENAEIICEYTTRPDIETLIRGPVEQAWGETAVVVCGGKEIVAETRNCVSRLSDERAVHKGTGAQGIYLHVEEYAF